MSVSSIGAAAPQLQSTASTARSEQRIPEGHTRSIARSAATGAVVGLVFGGSGSAATIGKSSPAMAAGIAALSVLSTAAVYGAVNYTNHNGTLHGGKEWNEPMESAAIGAAIGGAAGVVTAVMTGKPSLILPGLLVGGLSGATSGLIAHVFNRPS